MLSYLLSSHNDFIRGCRYSPRSSGSLHRPRGKITPVGEEFSWDQVDPIKYRPFKNAPYKMAMGLSAISRDEFLLVEKTYKKRCSLRARIFESRRPDVAFLHPSGSEALAEFYTLAIAFMCQRYPQYFVLRGSSVYNTINDCEFPYKAKECKDTEEMLRVLASNLEEDFLILVKNGSGAYANEYVLRAGATLFPAGFNPGKKANKPLSAIHTPVPQYKPNLKSSMNDFFSKVKAGQFFMRNNWSIQTHQKICALSESHATPNEKVECLDANTLDFNKVFLRVERQVVTRLPKTDADIMTIRTYLTPLNKLRVEDGMPEELCGAIDGLPDNMATYKRRAAWGEAVKAYMRKETDGTVAEIYDFEFET